MNGDIGWTILILVVVIYGTIYSRRRHKRRAWVRRRVSLEQMVKSGTVPHRKGYGRLLRGRRERI
jgi:hypothetical protein